MGKASICCRRCIQGPGLGRNRSQAGSRLSSKTGRAKPPPRVRNTASASQAGRVTAKPSAAPMKGAVHGLATTAARTPVAKVSERSAAASQRLARTHQPATHGETRRTG